MHEGVGRAHKKCILHTRVVVVKHKLVNKSVEG